MQLLITWGVPDMVYAWGHAISWWRTFALFKICQDIQPDMAPKLLSNNQGWAEHKYLKPSPIDERLSKRNRSFSLTISTLGRVQNTCFTVNLPSEK